jgi:hypothetical protein
VSKASTSEPVIGQVLDGRYRIVREIAVGGMSTVYEALHIKIGRTVAIKVLHRELADEPHLMSRFLNEARAVGTFGHPNIVASTDFGELPGHVPYLVLEYLDGLTINEAITKDGPLSLRRTLNIGLQIASALDTAHGHGVVHRDLKSANIVLVQSSGKPDHVKVLDFGISKFLYAADSTLRTRRGITMGTPEFMAPEQISDPREVDVRADIYALGGIMYQMLVGRPPFTNLPLRILLNQIVFSPPPPIERVDVPNAVRALVFKALAKEPQDRFANMREMGAELERIAAVVFAIDAAPAEISWSERAPAPLTPHPSTPLLGSSHGPERRRWSPRWRPVLYATAMAVVFVGFFVGLRKFGAPRTAEPLRRPPAAAIVVRRSPPAVVPPAPPAPVRVEISSPAPRARLTLRGAPYRLPFTADLAPGAQPELVELTAPRREGVRFRLTLDHPIRLAVELPPGRGMREATPEEIRLALGGAGAAETPMAGEGASGARRAGEAQRRASAGAGRAAAGDVAGDVTEGVAGAVAGAVTGLGPVPALPAAASPSAARLGVRPLGTSAETPLGLAPPPPTALAKIDAPGVSSSFIEVRIDDAAAPPAAPPKAEAAAAHEASGRGAGRPAAPAASAALAPAPAPPPAPLRTGSVDPAKTRAVVKEHLFEVQRCYERGKMDDPELKGRVTLRINLSAFGAVGSAVVESSTLDNVQVEDCICNAAQDWKFPAPAGGASAVISYPFNFR